jgi:antitoxin component of MazEF toxin-antitoxin module
MIKRLTRQGNSRALIIDKTIRELLQIEDDTPLALRIEGDSLIVSPVRKEARKRIRRQVMDEIHEEHGPALKKLAT